MCKEKINSAKLYSRSNRPRILIDMDDCITACLRAVVKAYNEENGTNGTLLQYLVAISILYLKFSELQDSSKT